MTISDDVLQGIVITIFTLVGVSAFGYCIRLRMQNKSTLKQSPSMEELNSVATEDPSV